MVDLMLVVYDACYDVLVARIESDDCQYNKVDDASGVGDDAGCGDDGSVKMKT